MEYKLPYLVNSDINGLRDIANLLKNRRESILMRFYQTVDPPNHICYHWWLSYPWYSNIIFECQLFDCFNLLCCWLRFSVQSPLVVIFWNNLMMRACPYYAPVLSWIKSLFHNPLHTCFDSCNRTHGQMQLLSAPLLPEASLFCRLVLKLCAWALSSLAAMLL